MEPKSPAEPIVVQRHEVSGDIPLAIFWGPFPCCTEVWRFYLLVCCSMFVERSPPIREVIKTGVVPCFTVFLTHEDYPQLQSEAALTLTNIGSVTSDNTKVVVEAGVVPIFVKLLRSDVRVQIANHLCC